MILIGGKKAGGVREEGEQKERRETRGGGGEQEKSCLFCVLITDVGKAHSRFCGEAFVAHEKAGWRGGEGAHRAGDCSAVELQGGKGQRD